MSPPNRALPVVCDLEAVLSTLTDGVAVDYWIPSGRDDDIGLLMRRYAHF